MALTISTLITDTKLKEGVSPLEISSITVVVNFNGGHGKTYFGGQVTLTAEDDGISFNSTTEALQDLAIVKAKRLIAEAQVVVPKPVLSPKDEIPKNVTSGDVTATSVLIGGE